MQCDSTGAGKSCLPHLKEHYIHIGSPITRQLADTPTCRFPTHGLVISQTCQLADADSASS